MLVNVNNRGDEISRCLFHKLHEKDQTPQANLKSAPKLTENLLHPGNCKQCVLATLAIVDPTTCAAIRRYFPEIMTPLNSQTFSMCGGQFQNKMKLVIHEI